MYVPHCHPSTYHSRTGRLIFVFLCGFVCVKLDAVFVPTAGGSMTAPQAAPKRRPGSLLLNPSHPSLVIFSREARSLIMHYCSFNGNG
jgi:hypothetical protein